MTVDIGIMGMSDAEIHALWLKQAEAKVASLQSLYAKVVKERDALKEVLDDIYATCTDDFVTSKIAVSRSSRREGK